MNELRVIDFGTVSALRSQSIWHALAASAGNGGPMTLSFMRPESPYVGIGMHRSIDEIDQDYCNSSLLPIFRRMVGGGPVYLDSNQLFFQVSVPREALPMSRPKAIEFVLRPFVAAFKAAGIGAQIDTNAEFSVDGVKVCGHGAGEIDGGVVVVGNLIEKFDHSRASAIMEVAFDIVRVEIESMMRRFVGLFSGAIDPNAFKASAISSLLKATHSDEIEVATITDHEWDLVAEYDELLSDVDWTRSPEFTPARPKALRVIKIRAGVFVVYNTVEYRSFLMSVVFGNVETLVVDLNRRDNRVRNESHRTQLTLNDALSILLEAEVLLDNEIGVLVNAGVMEREIAA